MQIELQKADPYSIQGCTESELTINGQIYGESLIVSRHGLIHPWLSPSCLNQLQESHLSTFLTYKPEVILFGHENPTLFLPPPLLSFLWSKHIGVEAMSISAASRSYNILLSEGRDVILGILRVKKSF